MGTEFYALPNGQIQGFGDGATPPSGSRLMDRAPAHGLDRFDFTTNRVIPYVPVKPLYNRLQELIEQLPDAELAAYAPLLGSVKPLLESGRKEAVRMIISNAQLQRPQHQPIKDALLAEFAKE